MAVGHAYNMTVSWQSICANRVRTWGLSSEIRFDLDRQRIPELKRPWQDYESRADLAKSSVGGPERSCRELRTPPRAGDEFDDDRLDDCRDRHVARRSFGDRLRDPA